MRIRNPPSASRVPHTEARTMDHEFTAPSFSRNRPGVLLAGSWVSHYKRHMKITLLSPERLRLENGASLEIMPDSVGISYSPFHMLASGLGSCMFSVLQSWATNAKIPTDHLAMEIGWTVSENPRRIGKFAVKLDWPSLPASRYAAAARAVNACAVHNTLVHPPEIDIGVASLDESATSERD